MGCYYTTSPLTSDKGDGMIFATFEEAMLAYSLGVVGTHANIQVRLPAGRLIKGEPRSSPGQRFATTIGRVLFNTMLPDGMPYYNASLRSSDLAGGDFPTATSGWDGGRPSTCWTPSTASASGRARSAA